MVIGGLSSNPCDWLVLRLGFIGENGIVPILPIRLLLNLRLGFPFDYLEIVSVLQKREEKKVYFNHSVHHVCANNRTVSFPSSNDSMRKYCRSYDSFF